MGWTRLECTEPGSTGLSLDVLGCFGLYWVVVGCTGLHWTVLGCTGLWWAVLGSTGLYWTVLGFTRLNWAVVGCSRLYCGVMGCTGRSQQLISVYSAIFSMVTTHQSNNQVIIVQACSWPVWEGSLLQKVVWTENKKKTSFAELENIWLEGNYNREESKI